MEITRRDMLGLLAASPLAVGGCCVHGYPHSKVALTAADLLAVRPILAPATRKERRLAGPVIDVHAHFFNASDLPVRGFLVDCIGHTESEVVQKLLRYLGWIADVLASLAPTADDEIKWLRRLSAETSHLGAGDAEAKAQEEMSRQRVAAAERVAAAIRGKRFELEYRQLKSAAAKRSSRSPISAGEILDIVRESETPSKARATTAVVDKTQRAALDADGVLRFLYYFLSFRSCNIDAYIRAFCRPMEQFGVDMVMGSLVDFDYWLDCPPRSSHDDQVELLALLASMHGGFLRPVVAYNPWTDIEQADAGIRRVEKAKDRGFVAAKIYPPTGFLPSDNEHYYHSAKRHPDLQSLDGKLDAFFDRCRSISMPVLAHAEQKNGRDTEHDDFSSPTAWRRRLAKHSSAKPAPVIDVGHFGGVLKTNDWTKEFATLMCDYPDTPLYGDLGFWPALMCLSGADEPCTFAKNRLKDVLGMTIGTGIVTVADRVMFGSDWLMLSQVDQWADYPSKVFDALYEITGGDQLVLAKIFGGNAKQCFNL